MSIPYRRPWSPDEDQALSTLVQELGEKNWPLISSKLQKTFQISFRSGKQCRERWINHLDPKINKSPFTPSEDELIFSLFSKFGKSWSKISKHLPGRSENSVKNRFYSALRRNLRKFNKSKPRSQRLLGSTRTILRKSKISEILLKERAPAKERKSKSEEKIESNELGFKRPGFCAREEEPGDDTDLNYFEAAQLLFKFCQPDYECFNDAQEGFKGTEKRFGINKRTPSKIAIISPIIVG